MLSTWPLRSEHTSVGPHCALRHQEGKSWPKATQRDPKVRRPNWVPLTLFQTTVGGDLDGPPAPRLTPSVLALAIFLSWDN